MSEPTSLHQNSSILKPKQAIPVPIAQDLSLEPETSKSLARTLWIGDLESWMDNKYLLEVFSCAGIHGAKEQNLVIIVEELTHLHEEVQELRGIMEEFRQYRQMMEKMQQFILVTYIGSCPTGS